MNRKQVALNCPNIEACLKKFEITTWFMEGEMKGSNRVTKVLELNNEYVTELLYTNNYPDKHIVVSYQHSTSNCYYAFVDEAELEYDNQRSETLFFHPAGKMKNTINDSYSVCFNFNSASCCSRLLCCPGGQWKIHTRRYIE